MYQLFSLGFKHLSNSIIILQHPQCILFIYSSLLQCKWKNKTYCQHDTFIRLLFHFSLMKQHHLVWQFSVTQGSYKPKTARYNWNVIWCSHFSFSIFLRNKTCDNFEYKWDRIQQEADWTSAVMGLFSCEEIICIIRLLTTIWKALITHQICVWIQM